MMFDILEQIPVPQFAVGLDNKITFWNKSCEVLTGYPAETMVGTDKQWQPFYPHKRPVMADLIVKNDTNQLLKLYEDQDITRSKIIPEGWEAANFFTNCNGRNRYIHFSAAPLKDADGNIIGALETLLEKTETGFNEKNIAASFSHRLQSENFLYKVARSPFNTIIGNSKAMMQIYEDIANAASSNVNVIIYGESGTGKELVAKAIHDKSDRSGKQFVTVNCGAIPESLVESEFFGYKKGAFSGAGTDKPGFLDRADGGTLFLDEIGEISQNMQVKLLRALEGGGFSPVGSTRLKKPDIRFIAATKKNLFQEVKKGLMREDFFYRIHILPVQLPPLRKRKEDIPYLIHFFINKHAKKGEHVSINEEIIVSMLDYPWPGNVRELENAIHRYLTFNKIDLIDNSSALHGTKPRVSDDDIDEELDLRVRVAEFEKKSIIMALEKHQWRKTKAAAALNISRKTLFRKMKNHNIT